MLGGDLADAFGAWIVRVIVLAVALAFVAGGVVVWLVMR